MLSFFMFAADHPFAATVMSCASIYGAICIAEEAVMLVFGLIEYALRILKK